MVADGFHSFSDGASNIVGLCGMWIAARPIDKTHPYGHKKYETFAAVGIAMLLFLVCFNILRDSIQNFFTSQIPQVNLTGFFVMFFTLAINMAVMNYEYKAGKRLRSDILLSDSLHTRADILTSLSVIIALIAVKIGYPILDPLAAIIIAIFILYSALDILRHSSRILCDAAALDSDEIEKIVMGIEGVRKCHKIRARGRADDIYVDLHVLVKDTMHINSAHQLSYKIENEIKKRIPGVSDVTVHMEPMDSQ
jgi:cation diffusion facilitator family transporter